jgi:hypothetical protein
MNGQQEKGRKRVAGENDFSFSKIETVKKTIYQ